MPSTPGTPSGNDPIHQYILRSRGIFGGHLFAVIVGCHFGGLGKGREMGHNQDGKGRLH
jgi:hypothetical protein